MAVRYNVTQVSEVSYPGRVRYRSNIAIPGLATRDETVEVLTEAVRRLLADRQDAQAVVVFAYRSPEESDWPYALGTAQGSRDGLGWTGDGQFDHRPDEHQIHITIGDATTMGERTRLTVPQ